MADQTQQGTRATTTEELRDVLDKIWNEDAFQLGLKFKPRPTDIIISPFAKSGTTWLQHIAHGIRTAGNMDFDEISAVTPWIEVAYDVGWDLEAEHPANPRVYKSHLSYHDIPQGGRYIISFRHPYDALISLYRFFEGWFFEPGTISMEEFVYWRNPRDEMGEKGYWYHMASWWEQRANPDVLLLCYEDMKQDLPATVRKVADFMGVSLDDATYDLVLHQSSRDFMLQHQNQFSEMYLHNLKAERAGLPPPISNAKVTNGVPDEDRYHLTPGIKTYLDEIWTEHITAKFGLASYDDLCQSLRGL